MARLIRVSRKFNLDRGATVKSVTLGGEGTSFKLEGDELEHRFHNCKNGVKISTLISRLNKAQACATSIMLHQMNVGITESC